ncbi:hypothetical protein H310_09788 [Aphanomyces invadans]|uniref:Uncharacterized protein n=1 Tax=Aphanomyces invadans TaxID=157072 RepID=A0A024TTK1_9STRA|nr:hypothetical protein H310_09788 [Aphanomyces invadans]ETV96926.1 hypothetical protein H310_09788 [Aphanomyces invadans]|eukprot:XP_008874172.1 hypothetical protein H310_09788 [Aphanomyces invadans]
MLKRLSNVSRALSPKGFQPQSPQKMPAQAGPLPLSPRLKLNGISQARPEDNQQQHHFIPVVGSQAPGLTDEILSLLSTLIHRMDEIKPKKLRSIRLGGELRGLLGKAEDELGAHADMFNTYVGCPGLHIQMQNFLASLQGLVPIVESIHAKSFLVNGFVKKSIQFAFQEITSYYSSMFTKLSLAVAKATGSAAEAAVLAALSKPADPPPTDVEEPAIDYDAMCLVAHQHFFGHGKEKDFAKAFRLYLTAAKHSHLDAMVSVGSMLRNGCGTEADQEAALQWFTRAADEGSPDGASNLGHVLMEKAALVANPHKQQQLYAMALVRLTQAGDRGVAAAQYAAGTLYHSKITPFDLVKAKEWYVKASAASHAAADLALGHMLFDQDKGLSAHYFQRALASHHTLPEADAATAAYFLGRIYSCGEDVPADVPRAEAFFRQAAEAGHVQATLEMAQRKLETPDEALRYLVLSTSTRSADQLAEASFLKGQVFESTAFRCLSTALLHYTAAAEQGHVEAAKRAAAMLYSGIVDTKKVPPNRAKAFELYSVAALKKDRDAMNALGLMHEEGMGCRLDVDRAAIGKGVEKNEAQATWHFAQAAALGYTVAKNPCR